MELLTELRAAVEEQAKKYKHSELKKAAVSIRERYLEEGGTGKKLLTKDVEAVAYSLTRMPATFGAVSSALSYTLPGMYQSKQKELEKFSLLDVGAGCGAASWALSALLPLRSVTCLERERAMRDLGRTFMQEGPDVLKNARWLDADLLREQLERHDVVVASYVVNELAQEDRAEVLQNLWEHAGQLLLLVEPGTPAGFAVIKEARELLLGMGAHIAAPCPHENACRLKEDDWCHFTCRIARSRLHRELKDGDAPYEDEKFTYLAITRQETKPVFTARILRHPYVEKGRVTLELCTREENKTLRVTKRDAGLFKKARKAKCGDGLIL